MTALVIPEVALFVFAFTTAATEVDAVCTSESVASEPLERAADVSVLAPYDHISAAVMPAPPDMRETAISRFETRCFPTEPGVVKVDVATFHILAGSVARVAFADASDAPSEVDAVSTAEFVFAVMFEASEVEAAFVFAFTTAATDDDADCTSERVASDPAVRPAPVSVRVPFVQTSDASVPNDVSVRVPAAQTFVGIEAIDDATEAMDAPRDVDAVRTVAFVFAFTKEPREVDAARTIAFVFPFTTDATDDVAVASALSV